MVHLIIRYLAIGMVVALAALLLDKGSLQIDQDWWWLAPTLFAIWIFGPTIAAYVLSRIYMHRPWFAYVMLGFLSVSAAFGAVAYFEAFFVSESSTAALVVLMVPLFQWVALALVGLGSVGVAAWLDRRVDRY